MTSRRTRILNRAAKLLSRTRLNQAPGAARDHLIIEAQQRAFREMHSRFTERASRGEGGLNNALDALDVMWLSIRDLRGGAPVIMKTLSSNHDGVQSHLDRFYQESTSLLEDAIRAVFANDLGQLSVPPDRMAVLIRVALEGLVVELAQARSPDDVVIADQAYADFRVLFERFVLTGANAPKMDPIELEPIPLPW
jgi:hypothetical protein